MPKLEFHSGSDGAGEAHLANQIASADVPDAVLDALQRDELVVFAGAGVSMGAPTRLPSFDSLARQLATGAGYPHKLKRGAAIDAYLGALEASCSVDLRRLTAELIEGSNNQPNGLHRAIIGLGTVSTLRVVTTNFDRCFQGALKLFDVPYSEYIAPVLPLGDAFNGIVQLHGQVPLAPNGDLILTVKDFGTAYVYRGWATKFLTDMFAKYTVVFIGYSGNDTIMRYLTRSLPGGAEHFAFTTPEGEASWRSLGITPITYSSNNNHAALQETVEELAVQAAVDHGSHTRRIRKIVEHGLPLTTVDETYIRRICKRIETLRTFTEATKTTEWLDWVLDRSILADLFEKSGTSDFGMARVWSDWLCRTVLGDDPYAVLRLVHQHGGTLPEPLWWSLFGTVFREYPQPVVAGKYLTLLMDGAQTDEQWRLVSMLISKIAVSDTDGALRLLMRSLQPKPLFAPDVPSILASGDFGLELGFVLAGGDTEIRDGWATLKPILSPSQRASLLTVTIAYLEGASLASRHSRKTDWRQDNVAGSRNTIAGDDVDRSRLGVGVLIDICRDVLHDICRGQVHEGSSPVGPGATLSMLLRSEYPICQRLGLHALAESGLLDAEETLDLIIKLSMLFDSRLSAELQQVLATAFPAASMEAKQRVMDHVLNYPLESAVDIDYIRYRVLGRLLDSDPDEGITTEAIAKLQGRNPDFLPLHPSKKQPSNVSPFQYDSGFETSGVFRGTNPKDIAAAASQWKAGQPETGWLRELRFAAGQDQTWAVDVLAELSACGTWTNAVWEVLLEGVADHPLKDASSILQSLGLNPEKESLSYSIFDALSSAWGREGWTETPKDVVEGELSEVFDIWRQVKGQSPWLVDSESDVRTIRHLADPRGAFASLYLLRLEQLKHISGDDRLADAIRSQLTEMVETGIRDRDATLVPFGQSAGFLTAADKSWTHEHLSSLFDWRRNSDVARLMWSGLLSRGAGYGFLTGGERLTSLARRLVPLMRTALPWVREALPHHVDQFILNHAFLFSLGLGAAQNIKWADPLLVNVSSAEREWWIESISRRLRTDEPAIAQLRERLSRFWLRRIGGLPTPMGGAETAALSSWLVASKGAFADFHELFMKSPTPTPSTDHAPRALIEMAWLPVADFPTESARVLTQLLKGVTTGYWLFDGARQIAIELQGAGHLDEAAAIFEQLARLGDMDSTVAKGLKH